MIVELFGLPSSGKTTLSKRLVEQSHFELAKIRNKKELMLYNLLFLVKHPINFFVALFYVVANSSNWPLFYYKFTNCFLHHNAKYQKALKLNYAILDQGYFQNILSVFEKPLSSPSLMKYLRFLLLPDKLIILDLPFSEVRKRSGNRGYFPREELGGKYIENWLEVVKQNYSLFLKNLKQIRVNYSIIDANQDSENITKQALAIIKK